MIIKLSATDFYSILPMVILAVFGMAVMLIDLFLKPRRKPLMAWLALLGFVAAGAAAFALIGKQGTGFSGMIALDPYAQVLGLVAIGAGVLTVLTSINYIRDRDIGRSRTSPRGTPPRSCPPRR